MKTLSYSILWVVGLLNANAAFAAAECKSYPKEEWAAEDTLKEAMQAEGYTIKKFKIDGNCYEIYGRNKEGKKVEIYFDMKTLAIVKAIGLKD
ncbi:PepSY domain-containing protein [Methylophilus medardicus]|uniref:PepSY domain-containing protein n=1 Tax=Methylophilus medardicus TaxID=2588534 RepID=A0A5B8CU93_9PROT|nr:PepSY domain-containing protein [Methylophilus medardicus]QDC44884.1 PepSY domain-containing protein [Methylophilus medardicus]QDC49891.1 PepSY domain-containing protein [Methylophilus medardicus]QDC53596.1 PepSY domain-containing protein [Methylophilus medardicus]